MKKLHTLLAALAVVITSNMFAEELGLKMSNLQVKSLNSYSTTAKGKSGGSGGIQKGLVQMDLSLNLGSNGPIFVGSRYDYSGYGFVARRGFGVDFRPGFTFNIDVAVHPYVSVGGYFGLDGTAGTRYGYYPYKTIGIGIGARGVFHIYQLISDKANTKVDPGKLDFYFPFHIGGIIYIGTNNDYNIYTGSKRASGGLSVGGGLGVRYYFTDKIGIIGEVGWNEMSVFKVGMAIKL